ncbi:hypothetical protein WDU94_011274, partial [Cyamophila willieti]
MKKLPLHAPNEKVASSTSPSITQSSCLWKRLPPHPSSLRISISSRSSQSSSHSSSTNSTTSTTSKGGGERLCYVWSRLQGPSGLCTVKKTAEKKCPPHNFC